MLLPANDLAHWEVTDLTCCEFAYSFVHMGVVSGDDYRSAWLLELPAV